MIFMRNHFMAMHSATGRLLICVECGELKDECKCIDAVLLKKDRKYSGKDIGKFLDDW